MKRTPQRRWAEALGAQGASVTVHVTLPQVQSYRTQPRLRAKAKGKPSNIAHDRYIVLKLHAEIDVQDFATIVRLLLLVLRGTNVLFHDSIARSLKLRHLGFEKLLMT